MAYISCELACYVIHHGRARFSKHKTVSLADPSQRLKFRQSWNVVDDVLTNAFANDTNNIIMMTMIIVLQSNPSNTNTDGRGHSKCPYLRGVCVTGQI